MIESTDESLIDLMVQHLMKVEYAFDINTDRMWVQVTCNDLVATEYSTTIKGLSKATRNCVKKLAEAVEK